MKRGCIGLSFFLLLVVDSFALISDAEALHYCHKNKHSYIITIWPNVHLTRKLESIEASFSRVSRILHKKSLQLVHNGPFLFVTKVYAKEQERTGNKADNFRLARAKERESFRSSNIVHVYLVEAPHLSKLLEHKRHLRSIFKLDFLHIPDTHEESAALASLVFSDAKINALNLAR